MEFLQKTQNEYKYKCFKKRLDELKTLTIGAENCEYSRFTICLVEASNMVNYLYQQLNIVYGALEKACDTAFCQDKDICDKKCSDECIKGAINKLLHETEMDLTKNNT